MTLHAISLFSIAAFGLCITGKFAFPVTTCKRNASDYSACLTRAIQESWPRFVDGFPEFEFPRLDPLVYEYGTVVFDRNPLKGDFIISNVIIKGLIKSRFSNIRTNFFDDAFHLEIDSEVPKVFLGGDMVAKGTLGGFKLFTKGHYNVSVENIRETWDITGHVVNDTAIIEHFIITPQIGKLKLQYNDSQGNQELYNLVVDFVNEFWPMIFRAALPFIKEVWDPFFVDMCNHFFSKVSFLEIFPEN